MENSVKETISAIEKNGYTVDIKNDLVITDNAYGILGRQQVADKTTKREKYLLYTNGSGYDKGYLTGLLFESAVEKMAVDYVDNVIWDFSKEGPYKTNWFKCLTGKIMAGLAYLASRKMKKDTPAEFHAELAGLYKGCKTANKKTKVKKWRLWVLNTGIDAILSIVYTGMISPLKLFRPFRKKNLKLPVMCHDFTVSGSLTPEEDLFFGRNFMFPTSDVFQLYAAQIVHEYKPASGIKCITGTGAPGFVGLITGMNSQGLGMGVNMVAGCNCNPFRPGLNSLLMVRLCVDRSATTEEAVQLIEKTRRGVSWLYILADSKTRKSCVVEAGKTAKQGKFLKYVPLKYRKHLPDKEFIRNNPSVKYRRGIMVRYQGFRPAEEYYAYNENLFTYYKSKHHDYTYKYNEADFDTTGMLDESWKDKNCPENMFFPPQREYLENMLIVSNNYLIPEMRLYSMKGITNFFSGSKQDDFIWRYDMLNKLLLDELKTGKIKFDRAREIINFISPKSVFAPLNDDYYTDKTKYNRKNHIPIEGSVSICNLDKLYMETITGYYEDNWVKLDLKDFL